MTKMNKKEIFELVKDLVIFCLIFAILTGAGIMTLYNIIPMITGEHSSRMNEVLPAVLFYLMFFFSAFIGGVVARRTHRDAIPAFPRPFFFAVLFLFLAFFGVRSGNPLSSGSLQVIFHGIFMSLFAWMGYYKPRRRLLPKF